MRDRDIRDIRRRLEEVEYIFERGYEPVFLFGAPLWEKKCWGSLHTHRGALRDIERDHGDRSAMLRQKLTRGER